MKINVTSRHERQLSPNGVAGVAPSVWWENHDSLPPHECGEICRTNRDSMILGFKEGVFYALTVLGLIPGGAKQEFGDG